ncbi:MAG: hypothetical protein Ct9H90mP27_0240 [Gammaproteobacteria bacterium]|nr:MAG: hypothetical protein Ct9H90mP27_0240 [Gammaproteobacteria bacterium]
MKNAKTKKVIVGMSGGVDSSVAAYLLKQQNFEVEGLFMKNWEEDDGTDFCTAKEDLEDAKRVCDKLNINCTSQTSSRILGFSVRRIYNGIFVRRHA